MGLFKGKDVSAGKRQQARAEAWDKVAERKKREFGRNSPEHKAAKRKAGDEWDKVPEWRKWTPFS